MPYLDKKVRIGRGELDGLIQEMRAVAENNSAESSELASSLDTCGPEDMTRSDPMSPITNNRAETHASPPKQQKWGSMQMAYLSGAS